MQPCHRRAGARRVAACTCTTICLFVDTGAAARRVEQLPWVEHATVRRDLPGTLEITVAEYTPAAYVRVPGGVMLVAANGHVIARRRTAPADAVEVRGVRRAPERRWSCSRRPTRPGSSAQLPAALAQHVVAVDVERRRTRARCSRGGGQIRLGDTSDLDAKAASALAVLGASRRPALLVHRRVDADRADRRTRERPSRRRHARMIDSATTLRYSLDAKHRLT